MRNNNKEMECSSVTRTKSEVNFETKPNYSKSYSLPKRFDYSRKYITETNILELHVRVF